MRNALSALVLVLCVGVAVAAPDPSSALSDLSSPDPAAREAARSALVEAGAEALPAIEEGLRSSDPLVSTAAAELAGELELRPARAALADLIRDPGAPTVARRAACLSLGRIGDSRDVGVLLAALDEMPEAALGLARLGIEDARSPLEDRIAAGDSVPAVEYAAAALGSEAGVTALVADLRDDGRRLEALRWLREVTGADVGTDPDAWATWWRRERLARRLGAPDWDASERALDAVRAAKEEGGESFDRLLDDLLTIARDTSADRYSRTKAVMALGLFGPKRNAAALLKILENDADGQVRLYCAEALGRLGVAKTAPALAYYLIFDEEPFRALSTQREGTRYFTIDTEVCKALTRMGITGGLGYMIDQMHQSQRVRVYQEAVLLLRQVSGRNFGFHPDGPFSERIAAADRWRNWFDEHRSELSLPTTTNLRDPQLLEKVRSLVDNLGNYDFTEMFRSREPLVLLGEVSIPAVLEGLSRPQPHIRVHCAEILGRLHAKRTRGALAALLTDRSEKPEVRIAVAGALAEMGPGDALPHVLEVLSDDVPGVRIEAARALAKADFSKAVPALRQALEDESSVTPAFRREALYALGAHGDVRAVDELAKMLDSGDVAFRRQVADRLMTLTARDPGVKPSSIADWRAFWAVSRESYRGTRGDGESR